MFGDVVDLAMFSEQTASTSPEKEPSEMEGHPGRAVFLRQMQRNCKEKVADGDQVLPPNCSFVPVFPLLSDG